MKVTTLLVALFALWAFVLPSLITQLNWLSPSGLMDLEDRRRWLIISWIIVIVGTGIIYWLMLKEEG